MRKNLIQIFILFTCFSIAYSQNPEHKHISHSGTQERYVLEIKHRINEKRTVSNQKKIKIEEYEKKIEQLIKDKKQSERDRKELDKLIEKLRIERKELDKEIERLNNRMQESSSEYSYMLISLGKKYERALDIIDSLVIFSANLINESSYWKDIALYDMIDTKREELKISANTYSFKKPITLISGFSANDSKIPKIEQEKIEFLKRLSILISKYPRFKICLTGTCSFRGMDRSMAKGIAENRALSIRKYLIDEIGFNKWQILEEVETSTKDCNSCNSVFLEIKISK